MACAKVIKYRFFFFFFVFFYIYLSLGGVEGGGGMLLLLCSSVRLLFRSPQFKAFPSEITKTEFVTGLRLFAGLLVLISRSLAAVSND